MTRSEARALLELHHENLALNRFSPIYIGAFVRNFDWLDWLAALGALAFAGCFFNGFLN